ncbi:alkaline phosphatase family protein [Longispora albida]|uniref:alkaline phosphatase family protein n=1 Tax=Longispora albida TaxID=203523 RepID=UPI000367D019|nr:nucleotide pyrophosphatase/phosphodiesterase family protein [Longispora albida]
MPEAVTSSGPPAGPRIGSLAEVLPGTLSALTGRTDPIGLAGARRAVVLLIDGFGYHLLRQAGPAAPTVGDILAGRLGRVDEIRCGFPSTTPTSLVSFGTGALPGAHGIVGFRVNVPGSDQVLTHIQWMDEPDPALWQPLSTQFELAGLRTAVFAPAAYEGSGLTRSAYRGAPYHGASLDTLADQILSSDADLVYGYHPAVDAAGHRFGIGSPQWLAEVAAVDELLNRLATELPAGTALIVTADHGMVDIPESGKVDFDAIPGLRSGVRVLTGEARVRYVHTTPGATADVAAAWRAVLGPEPLILTREEAVDTGWYGEVAPAHLPRIGDLVVVCQGAQAVVCATTEPLEAMLVGYHGAISPAETGIPLIVVPAR